MELFKIDEESSGNQSKCLINFKLINDRINALGDECTILGDVSRDLIEANLQLEAIDRSNVKRDNVIEQQTEILQELAKQIEGLKIYSKSFLDKSKEIEELSKVMYHLDKKIEEQTKAIASLQDDSRISTNSIVKDVVKLIISAVVGAILAYVIVQK